MTRLTTTSAPAPVPSAELPSAELSLAPAPASFSAAYRPEPLPPAAPPDADRLTDRHVLVVGIHYAPEPDGIGPYAVALAEHLATRAASVTVLSGMPHDETGHVDGRYRGQGRLVQAPANGAGPLVVRLGHHVPTRWTPLGRARYEAGFAARAASARVPHRPDVVVGLTPTPGSAAAATRLARRHGAWLVVVAQEVLSRGGGLPPRGLAGWPKRLERYALVHADRVAVTRRSAGRAVAALGVPAERIRVVPDGGRAATEALGTLLDGLLALSR